MHSFHKFLSSLLILVEFYFRKTMNSEGIQSVFSGMFGGKIETPDSNEFQFHSFSSTNCTFPTNSKADLKEEKWNGTDGSNPIRGSASPLQDMPSVKMEGPDRGRNDHFRVQTDPRPFECGICSKSFNRSGLLKRHLRVHTGDRPFSCDICSKSFKLSGTLKGHLRVHTVD